ncbi:hypothetical protein [Brevibacillus gelatini]|uniref:Uncharacterized protein n=1 Tax=Brevibacillus gelatini TaxID=1655277 RepID=A0A3M8AR33_9BACL|nr:hypothetical protein [Brevibacillus gelatini]RNB53127.1 hypothetical protein EDM57_20060 [Brevibacillus gelatini]
MEKTISVFLAFLIGFVFTMLQVGSDLDFLELPVIILNIIGLIIMVIFGGALLIRAIQLLLKND